jgi:hypothetical protein
MQNGEIDAWLVHLAEGVPGYARPPGNPISSRSEFTLLKSKGLLTDMTVIVHGIALEAQDFTQMRATPSIRHDGSGDELGAKLVWSPLSNVLLYGRRLTATKRSRRVFWYHSALIGVRAVRATCMVN